MLDLDRFPDWSDRLDRFLAAERGRAFEWGRADCATLWTGLVAALTGTEIASLFPPWWSERSALRSLAARGYRSVREAVADLLPETPACRAGRGDLGFTRALGPLASPAIVVGGEAVSRDAAGWIVVPRATLVACYRV